MGLGHEKLDVYRLSIGYVAWVYEKAGLQSVDFDPDSDFDPEERKSQQADPLDARTSHQ